MQLLQRILLTLFVLLVFATAHVLAAGSHVKHRRCYGDLFGDYNDNKDSMIQLHKSGCLTCTPQKIHVNKGFAGLSSPDVMIVLSPWMNVFGTASDVTHPMLTLAASILRKGLKLWVLHLQDPTCNPTQRDISRKLLSSMPCDLKVLSNETVAVHTQTVEGLELCKDKTIDDLRETGPFDLPERILPVMKAIEKATAGLIDAPKLLLTDASNVAGVLWGEKNKIASMIVASPMNLDLIQAKTAKYKGVRDFVARQLKDFAWGWKMMGLNRIRRSQRLKPLRFPSQYFEIPVAVMLHPTIEMEDPLPVNTHAVKPITPECIVCDPSMVSSTRMTAVVAPLEVDKMQLRAVIRGIAVARASLSSHADRVCDADGDVGSTRTVKEREDECRRSRFFSEIDVVVLVRKNQKRNLPELLPSFVRVEVSNPIDTLARHPYLFAIISHCGLESNIGASLGVTLLCLPKRPGDMLSVPDFRIAGSFEAAQGNEIAAALFTVLVDGRGLKSKTMAPLSNAIDVIRTALSILNKHSLEEIRSFQKNTAARELPPPQYEWVLRGFLGILYLLIGLTVCYAQAFLETVKNPSRIPAWKRRFRHISRFTCDEIDPLLLQFQKWLADPNELHNRIFDGILDKQQEERPEESGINREGSTNNLRRQKGKKKR